MSRAYRSFSTRQTAQSAPIPYQQQVRNEAGGYSYPIDNWTALDRFLILGSEGGTYYVTEKTLTKEAALRTISCIKENGRRVVDRVVEVSQGGLAPKNDPAIFVLALCAAAPDVATRQYALAALPCICRIPTHLMHFAEYVKGQRGWGRSLKRAVAEWYQQMPTDKLAYELVKYQGRDNWTNRDLLRKSHPKTRDVVRNAVYKWAVDGWQGDWTPDSIPAIVGAFERAKNVNTKNLVREIAEFNLSREMVPTEALTKPEVWEALLEKMPMTAMIRNLGNMSKVGLLKPFSVAAKTVSNRLHDEELLKKTRVHPIAILLAAKTYAQGHGILGKGTWDVVPSIVDALDDAFYLAFRHVEPTGKRLLIGIDCSGSMGSPVSGLPISAAEGAAAMALACAKVEQDFHIICFDNAVKRVPAITPKMRLDEVLRLTSRISASGTDCSVPMNYALEQQLQADAFLIVTDGETWAGHLHPSQALIRYRERMGLPAKLVTMAMTSTATAVGDINDAGTLNCSGFSVDVPGLIQEFIRG